MAIPLSERKYPATCFLGVSTSGVRRAVFYDPHTSVMNNKAGITGVFGDPGAGKTTFAHWVLSNQTLLNKTVIAIDFKSDLLAQANLEEDIGEVSTWVLGSPSSKGALDPIYIKSEPREQITLTMNFIEILVGDIMSPKIRNKVRSTVTDAINSSKDEIKSLIRVIEKLERHPDEDVRTVGNELRGMKGIKNSEICFYSGTDRPKVQEFDGKTTIITFYGMKMPKNEKEARSTSEGKLATGILYLLTEFIWSHLFESKDKRPKLLLVDEAWMLTSTEQGASIIEQIALLGRSKGIACMLMTQYMSHLKNLDIESTITTQFYFRTEGFEKAQEAIRTLGLTPDSDEITLQSLMNGECMMKDIDNNVSTLKVSVLFNDWIKAYNTNPMIEK